MTVDLYMYNLFLIVLPLMKLWEKGKKIGLTPPHIYAPVPSQVFVDELFVVCSSWNLMFHLDKWYCWLNRFATSHMKRPYGACDTVWTPILVFIVKLKTWRVI